MIVWQVLIPLTDKRSRIFHQIIKPWTYFEFSFDLLQCIIAPISYQLHFVQLVCVRALHPGFSLSPYLAVRVERWSADTHPFLLSWFCWSSDGDCAEFAWFVSVGFQQPALRHRKNRNVPKTLAAKTVPGGLVFAADYLRCWGEQQQSWFLPNKTLPDLKNCCYKLGHWCCREEWTVSQMKQQDLVGAMDLLLCWGDSNQISLSKLYLLVSASHGKGWMLCCLVPSCQPVVLG